MELPGSKFEEGRSGLSGLRSPRKVLSRWASAASPQKLLRKARDVRLDKFDFRKNGSISRMIPRRVKCTPQAQFSEPVVISSTAFSRCGSENQLVNERHMYIKRHFRSMRIVVTRGRLVFNRTYPLFFRLSMCFAAVPALSFFFQDGAASSRL